MPKGKKLVRKLWNLWTTIVNSVLLLVLGGSMASGALGLPSWLSAIPAGFTQIIGWFAVVTAMVSAVFSIVDFMMR